MPLNLGAARNAVMNFADSAARGSRSDCLVFIKGGLRAERVARKTRKPLGGRELYEIWVVGVAGGLETLPGRAAAFPDDCPVYIIFFWEQNSKPPKPPIKGSLVKVEGQATRTCLRFKNDV